MNYNYYLKTEPGYVVAFLDILGFSALINNNDTVALNSPGFTYNFAPVYKYITSRYTPEKQAELGIKLLWVSDSIFIAAKQENIQMLLQEMSKVIHWLFCTNLSVRGGIAAGSLYFETNLWGTAVVNAVGLEKIASLPRIIMQKSDFEQLKPYMALETDFWHAEDDCYCFDYFERFFSEKIEAQSDLESLLSVYARCIQENFEDANDTHIRQKWSHLAKCFQKNIIKNREYINSHTDYAKERASAFDIDTENVEHTDIYLSIIHDAANYTEGDQ